MMVEQSDERDALRARLAGMWVAVAGGWGEHADYADARGAQSAERMLALAQVGAGDRVLELACGPGGLGLAAAERVGPGGEVVLTDVAEEMTASPPRAAQSWAWATSPSAASTSSASTSPTPPTTSCCAARASCSRSSPAAPSGEIRRVLRPGGRAAVAVWAARERNPWLGLVMDVVSAQIGAPVPPPGIPGPFALGDADELRALLDDAGLADVRVEELSVPLRTASFDEWWRRTSALAGPLSAILAVDARGGRAGPARARPRGRARLRDRVGRARLPGRDADRVGAPRLAPGAPPDRHDLAHGRLAVGDARVQRADAEVEAPGLALLELDHERVEAPALLVDLDDVAGGDALGAAAR